MSSETMIIEKKLNQRARMIAEVLDPTNPESLYTYSHIFRSNTLPIEHSKQHEVEARLRDAVAEILNPVKIDEPSTLREGSYMSITDTYYTTPLPGILLWLMVSDDSLNNATTTEWSICNRNTLNL